jgi:PAS domain S-box-containing protein
VTSEVTPAATGLDALLPVAIGVIDGIATAALIGDTAGRIVALNRAAEDLLGIRSVDARGLDIAPTLIAEESRALMADVMKKVRAGETWRGDIYVRHHPDATVRVYLTDSPLRDATGAIVGVLALAWDVTNERAAAAKLEDSEARLRLALAAGGLGTWHWDIASGRTSWDDALETMFGLAPGSFDGTYDTYVATLHPDDRESVLAAVQTALVNGGTYAVRHRVVWPDGSTHWIEGLGQVTQAPDGAATGTIGCTRDITAQVEAEQQLQISYDETADAMQRTQRLLRVTADLAHAVTVADVGAAVQKHLQGSLGARRGALCLVNRARSTINVVTWFGYTREVAMTYQHIPVAAPTPMSAVVRTAAPVHLTIEEMREQYPAMVVSDEAAADNAHFAGLPLLVAGTVVGVMTAGFGSRDPFTADDFAFMESLAAQSGEALLRAQLLERMSDVTQSLQRSLAPSGVPTADGLELAAVYRAGGDEVEQVGGDWYDAVPLPDGRVGLVVGDVMGRGVHSSAVMTRIRAAVRAYVAIDPAPATVLSNLDRYLIQEDTEEFVTCVYVLVDPSAGVARYVNAGHPPILVVGADLAPRWPSPEEGDVPVGMATQPRQERALTLEPGATLVLFTDGLVERRDRDFGVGLAALEAAARTAPWPGSLGEVLTSIIRTSVDASVDDDITVLAARLDPSG